MRTLFEMVGRGVIRRSDILYSISPEKRGSILKVRKSIPLEPITTEEVLAVLKVSEFAPLWSSEDVMLGDSTVVLDYWKIPGVALGDLYEELRTIEITLHKYVLNHLKETFTSNDDEAWWTDGVPVSVKLECSRRWEESGRQGHSYNHTDFIHLWEIMEQNWTIFSRDFTGLYPTSTKPDLGRDLKKVNAVRNKVMHPVRGINPTDEDFELIRKVRRKVTTLPSPTARR